MIIKVITAAKRFKGKRFDLGEVRRTATSLTPDKSISCVMYWFYTLFTFSGKVYTLIVVNRPEDEQPWKGFLQPVEGGRELVLKEIEILEK